MSRIAVAAVAAALVAACASGPRGFLLPDPSAAPAVAARRMDLLVVTTRHATPELGVLFSGERDTSESVSEIVVSVPALRQPGEVQWARRFPPDPAREFATLSIAASGPENTRAWFERMGGSHRRVLVFVHGYNTRFESAVYRLAQIAADSGADAAPVLFTWPSRGRLFDYDYDRDSALFSRDALERLLIQADSGNRVEEITVLAHSMGALLAMEALRQAAIRKGRVPGKIRNVILASPDIDPQVFARQYDALGPSPPHFTIFVASDDRALRISRLLAGNLRRLGSIDPSKEPYRSRLEARRNITVIDLTAVKSGDRFNHGRFAEAPDVVQMIGRRLINGQVLSGR
jgi:esterase/lipase superfamily enzyme